MAIKNQTYYYNYSVEQLQEIADMSTTFTDFMRKQGIYQLEANYLKR